MAITTSTLNNNSSHSTQKHQQEPWKRSSGRMSNNHRAPLSFLDSSSDHSACSTTSSDSTSNASSTSSTSSNYVHSYKKRDLPSHAAYVALDCEMVQGMLSGESVVARVVAVDWKGRSLLDTYVAPGQPVSDYRTFVSGITSEHLKDAPSFLEVREQVAQLLYGDKILIGHALENDLASLQITHPPHLIRDTAYYEPFQRTNFAGQLVPRKLKELAKEKLNQIIQDPSKGPHDPVEDAVAALNLYKQHRPRWEACVSNRLAKERKEQERLKRLNHQQKQVLLRFEQQHHQQDNFRLQLQQQYYYHNEPTSYLPHHYSPQQSYNNYNHFENLPHQTQQQVVMKPILMGVDFQGTF